MAQSRIHFLIIFSVNFFNKVEHFEDINTITNVKIRIPVEKNIPHWKMFFFEKNG